MKTTLLTFALFLSLCAYSQNWIQKASIPSNVGVAGMISFSINNKLYVGGGWTGTARVDSFYEYDPTSDTWTQKANIPAALDGALNFVLNGKGYMCCGTSSSLVNSVYAYDPLSNTWQAKSNFPGPARQDGGGFSMNGKGYICGGFIGGSSCTNDMWQYNDTTDTWTQMANIPGPGRNGVFPIIINDLAYVGLGANSNTTAWYADLYRFNPDSNTYARVDSFPTRIGGCVYFTIGQTGYIGLGSTGTSYPNIIYKYSPSTNLWTQADTFYAGRFVAFSQVVNGKPYIGCGLDLAGTYYHDNWTWECTAPTISQHRDTLFSSLSSSCQWYLNDSIISGATQSYYIASSTGNYTVQALDSNSCSSSSAAYLFKPNSIAPISDLTQENIYPNPTREAFTLQVSSQLIGHSYYLYDLTGRIIFSGKINSEITRFDVKELSSGVYILQAGQKSYKVIKN